MPSTGIMRLNMVLPETRELYRHLSNSANRCDEVANIIAI